jgi:hypothetical protein
VLQGARGVGGPRRPRVRELLLAPTRRCSTRGLLRTLASGQPAPGSDFCGEWDDDLMLLKFGGFGASTSTDATWSFFEEVNCFAEARLYCVQQ